MVTLLSLSVALAALLHEIGHGVAAWGWSVPIRTLRLDLFGARMELGGLTGRPSAQGPGCGEGLSTPHPRAPPRNAQETLPLRPPGGLSAPGRERDPAVSL